MWRTTLAVGRPAQSPKNEACRYGIRVHNLCHNRWVIRLDTSASNCPVTPITVKARSHGKEGVYATQQTPFVMHSFDFGVFNLQSILDPLLLKDQGKYVPRSLPVKINSRGRCYHRAFPPILTDNNKKGIAATFQPFLTRVPNCAILTFLMYKWLLLRTGKTGSPRPSCPPSLLYSNCVCPRRAIIPLVDDIICSWQDVDAKSLDPCK